MHTLSWVAEVAVERLREPAAVIERDGGVSEIGDNALALQLAILDVQLKVFPVPG
jgi:hypothetical protein